MRKNKIRVCFFIDSLVKGGAQRQLLELATNLSRIRFEVYILIYHNINQFSEDLSRSGIPVVLIEKRKKFDLFFLWKLYRFFLFDQPDIVQSYLNTANFWARIAGKFAGVPRIITSERNIDIQYSRLRMLIEKLIHPLSDLIVVNAQSIKDLLINRLYISKSKVKVIYNGVNLFRFQNVSSDAILSFRNRYNLNNNDFVVVLPGRIQVQKNHDCLIRAIIELKSLSRGWKIVFVGNENDTQLKVKLLNLIKYFKLEQQFIFAGMQNDMAVVYAVADVVVLPSLWEGFPNVLLEAMSAGRVVVASNISDNAQIISHGVNGFLFDSNDYVELSSFLFQLFRMSAYERHEMGDLGRIVVSEKYSLEKFIKSYESIYEI